MALAIAGYLSVQLLPRRVRICALPVSSRACIRYPSNLISCSQSGPSGAFSTSLASCGLIQSGGEAGGTLRRVGIVSVEFARADFGIALPLKEQPLMDRSQCQCVTVAILQQRLTQPITSFRGQHGVCDHSVKGRGCIATISNIEIVITDLGCDRGGDCLH